MTQTKKRLLLVFPPMTMPTSPPLGVAMLGGYLRREVPEWDVTTLDLNLRLFRRLTEGMVSGLIQPGSGIMTRLGADAATLGRAVAAFHGRNNTAFFGRPDLYDRYGDLFLRFIEVWSEVFAEECAVWEKSGNASPLLKELVSEIDALAPDCVGFSVIFSQQLPVAAMLGRFQRQWHGRSVFFGGGCFSGDGAAHFLDWYPGAADAVVTGDGELPLKALLQGVPPEQVAGVSCRRDGRVVSRPPEVMAGEPAANVPDFTDLDLAAYASPFPVVPLLLARGCYWRRCAFCVHHRSAGAAYRPAPVATLIDILRGLVGRGITKFSFVDEMIPPRLFRKLAEGIIAAGLKIDYYALARPEAGFTLDVLRLLASSGCRYLLWGVESASQRMLDLMNKGTRLETVAQVLEHSREAGIRNHVYIMCGFPTETGEEWRQTVHFLDDHRQAIQGVHRGVFALELGSPVALNPERFFLRNIREVRRTPLGPRLAFDCAHGMSQKQAAAEFKSALPFLKNFNPHARLLVNFRDHALLMYAAIGGSALSTENTS